MVCEWFIDFMALIAHCLEAYVIKAHPIKEIYYVAMTSDINFKQYPYWK